jgi:hypothetical protein
MPVLRFAVVVAAPKTQGDSRAGDAQFIRSSTVDRGLRHYQPEPTNREIDSETFCFPKSSELVWCLARCQPILLGQLVCTDSVREHA